MLKTENIKFHYKPKEHVFSFPNISLDKQKNLLIVGKSGVGKTTLLHLLGGLLKPISGKLLINNTSLSSMSEKELDGFRGQNIGIIFQKNYAIKTLNVFDNLKARLFFSKKTINIEAIDELLIELNLLKFKHRKIQELSEGQLQRLGIALAVIHNPKVILADEPTSSLDDENCTIVINLLKKQAYKNNANLIVITHDHRIKPFFQNSISL